MFRRFMIICWALFGIGLLSALSGYAGHSYTISKAERLEIEATPPSERSSAVDWKPVETLDSRELRISAENWIIPLGGGLGLAALMLIWNIIWHTAHWIWMGRKDTS
jgi:hypothetical protein